MTKENIRPKPEHAELEQLLSIPEILNATNAAFFILNQQLEVIYYNKARHVDVDVEVTNQIQSLGLGNILECKTTHNYACKQMTKEQCNHCELRQAIRKAIETHEVVTDKVVMTNIHNVMIASNVRITPIVKNEETYFILSLTDCSQENRMQTMGRLLLHDLINQAGGLAGYLEIISSLPQEKIIEQIPLIKGIADELYDLVGFQRDVNLVELGEYEPDPTAFSLYEILDYMKEKEKKQDYSSQKKLKVIYPVQDISLTADFKILVRVLSSMLKNASESTKKGSSYQLEAKQEAKQIVFSVYNKDAIAEDIKNRIYTFGATKKEFGYGLGTYSIRLLTENVLGGKVWFDTSQEGGTTFFVSIPLTA